MAYTTAIRDHVYFFQSDGTGGGVTVGDGLTGNELRVKTIRWIPAAVGDTVTISRVTETGTTEVLWEAKGNGVTVEPQESRLELRLTRGCVVLMTTGGKLYLYLALDGPSAR